MAAETLDFVYTGSPYGVQSEFSFTTWSGGALATGITWGKGNVNVSKNGAAFGSGNNTPSEIGSTGIHTIRLDASEINAANVVIQITNAAIIDCTIHITTQGDAAAHAVAYDSNLVKVAGSNLAAHATGYTPADFRRVDGIALDPHDAGKTPADVRHWIGVAPNALVSGRVDGSVGAMASSVLTAAAIAADAITAAKIAADAIGSSEIAAGAITAGAFAAGAIDAAAIATDAIGAAELAADAITEIAQGVHDLSVGGNPAGSLADIISVTQTLAADNNALIQLLPADTTDAVWDELTAAHGLGGSFGVAIGKQMDDLFTSLIAGEFIAAAGSSTTEIRTSATEADGFYDGMEVVVVNAAGTASRRISAYLNTNGAFTVAALPFTPAASDVVYALNVPEEAGTVSSNLTQVDGVALTAHADGMVPADIRALIGDTGDAAALGDLKPLVQAVLGLVV